MSTYPAEFDFSLVEKLDQRRPRNVQHVRRFLCGQFGAHRDQRDGIPLRHLFKNVNQHPYSGGRNLHRSFCWIVEDAKPEGLCRPHP